MTLAQTISAAQRILVLDGAMGTMLQQQQLTENDFRGTRFTQHPCALLGDNDALNLTQPHIVQSIHRMYLEAGADIITTNTFNSQRISQEEYQLTNQVTEMNLAGAQLARQVADEFTQSNPSRPRYVLGSIGPTSKMASLSPDINNPTLRSITFHTLVTAYTEQISALIRGGVDALLMETIVDTLNVKAAIYAALQIFEEQHTSLPILLSATIADHAGRLLAGQTPSAFITSVAHAAPLTIGLNCSFGADSLLPYARQLAVTSPYPISIHPNAGLPNALGQYDTDPQTFAQQLKPYLQEQLLNIVGGCCGTTPDHIAALATLASQYTPRPIPTPTSTFALSGLEPLTL